MTSLTQEQINWLDECSPRRYWTLNPKTGLVDVAWNFDCSDQGLSDFKGVKFGVIKGHFYCYRNSLTSLEGAPRRVFGNFDCEKNLLTTLEGAPQWVGGNFGCSKNHLTSLVGAPRRIRGFFFCGKNSLTSLEGAPLKVLYVSDFGDNPVSEKTLYEIFKKMREGHSFVIAAASLRNEMSKKDWKLIAPHIPEAIRPGVNMLARFGVFG